ncbi:MAG TPA: hypothetical protein VFB85_21695 [Vicinamibacterales bacterium]|jgi:hypothetical protein|nr:hypothetical protein [Vicinamibacterales bacterium]
MQRIKETMRNVLIGSVAAAIFVTTTYAQINDSIRGPAGEINHFIETPKGWVHPKTPWGEPDIQATLNMMQAAGIPLERCANAVRFGGPPCDMNKAWWTEEEYKQRIAQAAGRGDLGKQLLEKGEFGRALLAGVTDLATPQRQTTLIVDPPNGLLPALTAEGKKRALAMRSGWSLPGESPSYDSPEDFDSWDRCTTRGMPSSMMPYRYNGGFKIWQAPGVVVFDLEMIHDARVIYTDGRPPLKTPHKEYMGESRGRWEGNTLVVETTNYKGGHAPLINLAVVGSPAGNRFPQSDQMKTTERITRLNDDMFLYEIRTEDPVILTAPFTVRYPMRYDPKYEWWEYACHEGNSIVPNYTTTSRHERQNPEAEPANPATDAKDQVVRLAPDVAKSLAGRWVGRPRLATIDYDIEVEFSANADGTVIGKLIRTTLPKEQPVNQAFRNFRINGRQMSWEFPNTQSWNYAGELAADGTSINGVTNSAQGGIQLTFRKRS